MEGEFHIKVGSRLKVGTHRDFHRRTLIIHQLSRLLEVMTIISLSLSASQTSIMPKHVMNTIKLASES